MKLVVSLAVMNTGIAKESKKPYSMCRASVLVPFVDIDTENYQAHGTGFSTVDLSVSPSFATTFVNTFTQSFKGTPVIMDCVTSLDRDGKNVIIGFEKV